MPAGPAAMSAAHVVLIPRCGGEHRTGPTGLVPGSADLGVLADPSTDRRAVETFPEHLFAEWAALGIADPQELRALELEAIDDYRRARHVRHCRTRRNRFHPCNFRLCRSCARIKAARYAWTLVDDVRQMSLPSAFLFGIWSRGLADLGPTIDAFHAALAILRAPRAFRDLLPKVSGLIEASLAAHGHAFLVHGHLVADSCPDDEELSDMDQMFRGNVGGRVAFVRVHPALPDVDPRNCVGLAKYATKWATWCPKPGGPAAGGVSLRVLHALSIGLHDRQLPVRCGVTSRGRR